MRINDVAKRFGIKTNKLRFYEKRVSYHQGEILMAIEYMMKMIY